MDVLLAVCPFLFVGMDVLLARWTFLGVGMYVLLAGHTFFDTKMDAMQARRPVLLSVTVPSAFAVLVGRYEKAIIANLKQQNDYAAGS